MLYYIRNIFYKIERNFTSTWHRNLFNILASIQKNDTGRLGQQNKDIDFGSIRKSNQVYSIMQQLDSEIEKKRIYTFIHIDWMGRIVKNDIEEVCRRHEETMDQAKIKSFKREKSLKDLGI